MSRKPSLDTISSKRTPARILPAAATLKVSLHTSRIPQTKASMNLKKSMNPKKTSMDPKKTSMDPKKASMDQNKTNMILRKTSLGPKRL